MSVLSSKMFVAHANPTPTKMVSVDDLFGDKVWLCLSGLEEWFGLQHETEIEVQITDDPESGYELRERTMPELTNDRRWYVETSDGYSEQFYYGIDQWIRSVAEKYPTKTLYLSIPTLRPIRLDVGDDPGPSYINPDSLEEMEIEIRREPSGIIGMGRQYADALARSLSGQAPDDGVALTSEAHPEQIKPRVSRVYQLGAFPSDARQRGWGLIHDQIWFYVSHDEVIRVLRARSRRYAKFPEQNLRELVAGEVITMDRFDIVDDDGRHFHYRREDDGRWLRLYMDRRMLWLPRWLGKVRVRIHHFFSGDDDAAPHDHPWGFITFPLATYSEDVEQYSSRGYVRVLSVVRRFRFHYRPATYRHFVHEPDRPFRTIVIARESEPRRVWGFWPEPDRFVPFTEWTEYQR